MNFDFDHVFTALTGYSPFPWQRRLFERFVGKTDHAERFPACSLPTGLGKTSVMAVWLLALAKSADDARRDALRAVEGRVVVLRRLVYIVNRRTIVDQATREAEKFARLLSAIDDKARLDVLKELRQKPKDVSPEAHDAELRKHAAIIGDLRASLILLAGLNADHDLPLAISTLRGQFADNGEWAADPARPAIIVGTVDMIGSRLLFSGYGRGFKSRPLHAGFLGQDTLLVHDEAHLEPAFQKLLDTIRKEQTEGRYPDFRPLQVMPLTATPRTESDEKPFELEKDDFEHSVIQRRLNATKRIELHPIDDERKSAEKVSERALVRAKSHSGSAIIVFLQKVKDVDDVVKALIKAKIDESSIQLLTGTQRGLERDRMADPRKENASAVFARFLKPPSGDSATQWKTTPKSGTVFLVCTSAGEVGVDISADHLVCDLTTFDSMAQRFGRVNRYGDGDAHIDVVHPEKFSKDGGDKDYQLRRQNTLDLMRELDGDGSPKNIGKHLRALADSLKAKGGDQKVNATVFSPEPRTLPATDIFFDIWAMTTITGKLPGRPPVEPFLHGIRDEPPETHVAWREEVSVIVGDLLDEYPPRELLEEYPLKPHELLRDRTDRVWAHIAKLAERHPAKPVWLVDEAGEVKVIPRISELAALQKKDAEAQIAGKTVLLPHDIGGLTSHGVLDGDQPPTQKQGEPPTEKNHDVADVLRDDKGLLRVRQWSKPSDAEPKVPEGMKPVCQIVLTDPDDEDDEPIKTWHWFARVLETDVNARSRKRYDLVPHLGDAKDAATRFVAGLSLNPEVRDAVLLAAHFHDLGKERERWQRGIGNVRYPQVTAWAKSGKLRGKPERSPYRHEFGSVLDALARPEVQAMSDDAKDLMLHLIAAHHGCARPHFIPQQTMDEKHPPDAARAQLSEVPRRFARLQRKYGRWGLAYLESLVRAADYAASDKADREGAKP